VALIERHAGLSGFGFHVGEQLLEADWRRGLVDLILMLGPGRPLDAAQLRPEAAW
jgi:hypothetical protein